MERLLSGSVEDTEDEVVDRLPEGERDALLDRFRALVGDLPLKVAA
jgi:hypothetical protein